MCIRDSDKQSHDVAKTIRPKIQKIAKKYGANIKIVEVPPGPPVLSTIVAEVYGPNYDEQVRIANEVQNILKKTDDVVDVDWMVEAPQTEFKLVPDNEKAMLNGIAPQQLVGNLTSVSYTHLDVYKRQVLCKTLRRVDEKQNDVSKRRLRTDGENTFYRRCSDAWFNALEREIQRFSTSSDFGRTRFGS